MPSNEYQWTGWIFAIFTPFYILAKLAEWAWGMFQAPLAGIESIITSAHLTYGILGYFLLFFLLVFPFVAKRIFSNTDEPIPQASIVLTVLGFLGYLIYQWDYFSHNFNRMGDDSISQWFYTPMIVVDFALAPILGGIALCYSLITLTMKTGKFIVEVVFQIVLFFINVHKTATTIWKWFSSRFTKQARQEYRQEQAQQQHREEAHYRRENPQDDFDPNRFNEAHANSSTQPMPYGVDKRHPDVAKIWAMADDPANPPHVRKLWYAKALDKEAELEAKKRGGTGGIVPA